jgi:hypothetical protein
MLAGCKLCFFYKLILTYIALEMRTLCCLKISVYNTAREFDLYVSRTSPCHGWYSCDLSGVEYLTKTVVLAEISIGFLQSAQTNCNTLSRKRSRYIDWLRAPLTSGLCSSPNRVKYFPFSMSPKLAVSPNPLSYPKDTGAFSPGVEATIE